MDNVENNNSPVMPTFPLHTESEKNDILKRKKLPIPVLVWMGIVTLLLIGEAVFLWQKNFGHF